MSSKEKLINNIVHLLLTEFEPHHVTAGDRAFLERSTVSYLESKLKELQSEIEQRTIVNAEQSLANAKEGARRQRELFGIFKYSGLKNTPENERLLDELLPGPTLSFENFRSLAQNPQIAAKFSWDGQPFERVIAHETADRRNFDAAAKVVTSRGLNNVSNCDANFNAVREKLGTPLSVADVLRVLTDASITGLAPAANASELRQEANEQAILQHNRMLSTADVPTLRTLTNQDFANRQTEAQKQAILDKQAQAELDARRGFKVMPEYFKGQKLDREFIRKCSGSTLKRLMQLFGATQVMERRGN
jgi:hypothetical protein